MSDDRFFNTWVLLKHNLIKMVNCEGKQFHKNDIFKAKVLHIKVVPPKMEKCSVAEFLEVCEVFTVCAPHGLHHLLTQLHGGWHRLGITAQNVAKVYME